MDFDVIEKLGNKELMDLFNSTVENGDIIGGCVCGTGGSNYIDFGWNRSLGGCYALQKDNVYSYGACDRLCSRFGFYNAWYNDACFCLLYGTGGVTASSCR